MTSKFRARISRNISFEAAAQRMATFRRGLPIGRNRGPQPLLGRQGALDEVDAGGRIPRCREDGNSVAAARSIRCAKIDDDWREGRSASASRIGETSEDGQRDAHHAACASGTSASASRCLVDRCTGLDERLELVAVIPKVDVHGRADSAVTEPERVEFAAVQIAADDDLVPFGRKPRYSMPTSY